MNGVKAGLATVGLILVGMFAWWLIKMLFGAAIYVMVGALVAGGALCLYAKANRSLNSGDPRRIRR